MLISSNVDIERWCIKVVDVLVLDLLCVFQKLDSCVSLFLVFRIAEIHEEPLQMPIFVFNLFHNIHIALAVHVFVTVCGEVQYSSVLCSEPHRESAIPKKLISCLSINRNSEYVMPTMLLCWFPFEPTAKSVFVWEHLPSPLYYFKLRLLYLVSFDNFLYQVVSIKLI